MSNVTLSYLSAMSDMIAKMKYASKDRLFYHSIEQFVLENGSEYAYSRNTDYGFGKMRECFMNAFQLAIANPELTYVEGYATSIIPTLHAWCITKDCKVVDNTWKHDKNAPNRGYYGVWFPTDYIMQIAYKRGKYGIIDNLEMEFPLLQAKFDRENLK